MVRHQGGAVGRRIFQPALDLAARVGRIAAAAIPSQFLEQVAARQRLLGRFSDRDVSEVCTLALRGLVQQLPA